MIKNMAALIFRLNMNIREHISVNYFTIRAENAHGKNSEGSNSNKPLFS